MVPLPPGERESWGAIGGIVVLVLLVVMLLALLLLYRRRQKDKQNHTPTVSFSTSRTVNSEYAVPGLNPNVTANSSPPPWTGRRVWAEIYKGSGPSSSELTSPADLQRENQNEECNARYTSKIQKF